MPKVVFKIVEEDILDSRSNEVAYKITVENHESHKIALYNLNPIVPRGIKYQKIESESQEAEKEKYARLCSELTMLLEKVLACDVRTYEKASKHPKKPFFSPLFPTVMAFIPFVEVIIESVTPILIPDNTLRFEITNYKEGEQAYINWIKDREHAGGDIVKSVFEAKLSQVYDLEQRFEDIQQAPIAYIESGACYSRNYVVRFRRDALNQKKFNFYVEGKFKIIDIENGLNSQTLNDGITKSVTITPTPLILSLIAMGAGLLGSILKFSETGTNGKLPMSKFLSDLGVFLINGEGIRAMILALVFFNIYEHTQLGKSIRLGLDWRVALVIGILCGLVSERIIEAIKTILGAVGS